MSSASERQLFPIHLHGHCLSVARLLLDQIKIFKMAAELYNRVLSFGSQSHSVTANIETNKSLTRMSESLNGFTKCIEWDRTGTQNKHAQASRRLPLTKRIQQIRLALC